jgi:hypothetical protein
MDFLFAVVASSMAPELDVNFNAETPVPAPVTDSGLSHGEVDTCR